MHLLPNSSTKSRCHFVTGDLSGGIARQIALSSEVEAVGLTAKDVKRAATSAPTWSSGQIWGSRRTARDVWL